jgi:ankyrin repeat protein
MILAHLDTYNRDSFCEELEGTALSFAIYMRDWTVASRLIEVGCSSLLSWAACAGIPIVVKFLLNHGANPNAELLSDVLEAMSVRLRGTYWEEPRLSETDINQTYGVVIGELIRNGLDANAVCSKGKLPLHRAIEPGLGTSIVSKLLDGGADPYLSTAQTFDCFTTALCHSNSQVIRSLL